MRKLWCTIKTAVQGVLRDDIFIKAAAISFFSALSLAPLLILLVTAGGLAGAEFQQDIVNKVQSAMGPQAGDVIAQLMEQAKAQKVAMTFSAIAGLATTLLGATIVMVNLQKSLNDIFRVRLKRNAVINWLYKRFASLLMLLGIGVLLVVSVTLSSILGSVFPQTGRLAEGLHTGVSMLIFTLLFTVMFALLPDVKIAWSATFVGALITAILFEAGQYGISKYLAIKGVSSVYGAAGSLVVLLIWVYYTSIVVLFGAELTRAFLVCFDKKLQPNALAEWKDK